MSIEPNAINERWNEIRRNKKDCNLSLDEESVASYLARPESELVQARILESLIQLGNYRVNNRNGFVSKDPDSPGPMATCEGLEAFLVPAVEGALPFSTFLEEYEGKGKDKKSLVKFIKEDIEELLENWAKAEFPGDPYSKTEPLRMAIEADIRDVDFKNINITESAALACRVLIHLLTLKLNRSEENLFRRDIGDSLATSELFKALSNAIDFLVRAFQCTETEGGRRDADIVNATVGKWPGSGWSWTDRRGLPPMLFFTAAAVDAFAELDLYLIRTVLDRDLTEEGKILESFYEGRDKYKDYDIRNKLLRLQLCVDMARRWILNAVLPKLIDGYGQYIEIFPGDKSEELEVEEPKDYAQFKDDLTRIEKTLKWPTVFYNSLYALLILLWSWGDWDDAGKEQIEDSKNRINRALGQIVYNYSSIPVIREILNRYRYTFVLPGKGVFIPDEKEGRKYLDAGFLPLLTRLLVLFVVYGVGDRNLLEPVIRDLYVELLQNRHRRNVDYSALWSTDGIEIFSTQRALQALTFYFAYARGKEKVEGKGKLSETITLRNRTGFPLVLEAVAERSAAENDGNQSTDTISDVTFEEYCRNQDPTWRKADNFMGDLTGQVLNNICAEGDEILSDYKTGAIVDARAAKLILNSLKELAARPEDEGQVRLAELRLIERQFNDLKLMSSRNKAQ